jgi:oligoendopeptidase F
MEIKQKKRVEIPDEFKWHLNDLVASDEVWKRGIESMQAAAEKLAGYQGKLNNAATLKACLDEYYLADEEMGRLYAYANMKFHEDTNVTQYQGMADTAQSVYVKLSAAAAFIEPEILLTDEAELLKWLDTTPGMAVYKHYIDNLLRSKEHILSKALEELLASASYIIMNRF